MLPQGVQRHLQEDISKKHWSFPKSYEQALTVVEAYLQDPVGVNKPPQLIRLSVGDGYELWKLHGVVGEGLKPGQWPRLWFGVVSGDPAVLVPLALDVHQRGYSDNDHEREARRLLKAYISAQV